MEPKADASKEESSSYQFSGIPIRLQRRPVSENPKLGNRHESATYMLPPINLCIVKDPTRFRQTSPSVASINLNVVIEESRCFEELIIEDVSTSRSKLTPHLPANARKTTASQPARASAKPSHAGSDSRKGMLSGLGEGTIAGMRAADATKGHHFSRGPASESVNVRWKPFPTDLTRVARS